MALGTKASVSSIKTRGGTDRRFAQGRREPGAGSVLGLVSLQRIAGNRAVTKLLTSGAIPAPTAVQRKALPDFAPKHVGELQESLLGVPLLSEPVTATRELVPNGVPARTFEGFSEELQAVVAARRSSQVAVVIRDTEDRYHAFETDVTSSGTPLSGKIVPADLDGEKLIGGARFKRPAGVDAWQSGLETAKREKDAAALDSSRNWIAEFAYKVLLVDAMGIPAEKVRGGTGGSARWRSGFINIDLKMTDFGRNGHVDLDPSSIEPLPEPKTAISPAAFTSPALLEDTITHELSHAEHTRSVIRRLAEWRAAGRPGRFETWLMAQGIDKATLHVMLAKLPHDGKETPLERGLKGNSSNTELLSYLAGFRVGFEQMGPSAGTGAAESVAGLLYGLDLYWFGASPVVQDKVVADLKALLKRADPGPLEAFREGVKATRGAPKNKQPPDSRMWRSLAGL